MKSCVWGMEQCAWSMYHKWEKFHWDKFSWYSHYMDFPSNTFVVQAQGTYMLYLEKKIHGKKLSRSKLKFNLVKLSLFTVFFVVCCTHRCTL